MNKFKIMHPEDSPFAELKGKPYKPPKGCMVVMNGGGKFLLWDNSDPYFPTLKPLSEALYKYDVVWKH